MCLAFLQLCTGQNKDTFKNPILENAADPYAYLHEDGNYYFMAKKVRELADDRRCFKTDTHPVEVVRPITDGDPNNYRNLIEGAWVTFEN